MYMPRSKGSRLPHFALAFNVFVMPSGSVLSTDDLLLATGAAASQQTVSEEQPK
jgi:hypothetical protein